jgi:CdiI N-terminal domain
MFSLKFIAGPLAENGELSQRGRITLGDFSERFISPLVFWTPADYERQWIEGAQRIVDGAESSCFVTAMRESPFSGVVFLWPAYRVGQNIYLQHRLILPEHVNASFDPSDPYAQIGRRETLSADGEQLSEWQIDLSDVARFVNAA